MLKVWSLHQQTCGGYFDGGGEVRTRIKVPKSADNVFNNQQGLEAVMEDPWGW